MKSPGIIFWIVGVVVLIGFLSWAIARIMNKPDAVSMLLNSQVAPFS